jgi:hypothetical protein
MVQGKEHHTVCKHTGFFFFPKGQRDIEKSKKKVKVPFIQACSSTLSTKKETPMMVPLSFGMHIFAR